MLELKTKRLLIREYKKSDMKYLIENINDLNVTRWLLVVPYPYTKKDAIWWINKTKSNARQKQRVDYDLAIIFKKSNNLIGGIGINKVDKYQGTADIGYWIGKKYWGNGYATETLRVVIKFAFDKIKLRRLDAYVFVGNEKSGKVLEKCGFVLEGKKRKYAKSKSDGKVYDGYVYGLLKEEYKR